MGGRPLEPPSFPPFPKETALEGVFAHLHQLDPVSVWIMCPALPVSVISLSDSGIQGRSRFSDPFCRLRRQSIY